MDYSVCYKRGTKKKSESPDRTGIEPMTSRTPYISIVGNSNVGTNGTTIMSRRMDANSCSSLRESARVLSPRIFVQILHTGLHMLC